MGAAAAAAVEEQESTMPDIAVTIAGTPPDGSYSSSSNKVDSSGNIRVNPGVTSIQFVRGASQTWSFQSPWVTFNPAGPFTLTSQDAGQVTISDNDPGGGQDRTYEYTLCTSAGNFDPSIINKGSGK
jgi:hypothetical protein